MGDDYERAFHALAHEKRLAVLDALARAESGAMTAGELVDALEIVAPLLSVHLRVLRKAGVVRQERRGKYIDYTLDCERVAQLREYLARFI